jgi:hypothetical protein
MRAKEQRDLAENGAANTEEELTNTGWERFDDKFAATGI